MIVDGVEVTEQDVRAMAEAIHFLREAYQKLLKSHEELLDAKLPKLTREQK